MYGLGYYEFIEGYPTVHLYEKEVLWDDETRTYLGSIPIAGSIELDHLIWALLQNENEEYPTPHVFSKTERYQNWGATSGSAEMVLEFLRDPVVLAYISSLMAILTADGINAVTRKIFPRIKSEPITEKEAAEHAMQALIVSHGMERKYLKLVGGGLYEQGTRWVLIDTPSSRYRIAVAKTRRGGVSIGIESWEDKELKKERGKGFFSWFKK